jgi:hypothetical protein
VARPKSDTGRIVYWQVFTQMHVYLVEANSAEEAIPQMLKKLGLSGKTYLARDWRVKLPKPDEVERHLRLHTTQGQVTIARAVRRQSERLHFHLLEGR